MAEVSIGSIGFNIGARRVNVYIDFNRIEIATGNMNLQYCYCLIIATERICIFIDYPCIEIVTEHIS